MAADPLSVPLTQATYAALDQDFHLLAFALGAHGPYTAPLSWVLNPGSPLCSPISSQNLA